MILFLLAVLAPQTDAPTGPSHPVSAQEVRYHDCIGLATTDPQAAETRASQWLIDGGGFVAQECLGVAYSNEQRWADAAAQFEGAAKAAALAKDDRAASDWAEAGNAWLAAGEAARAKPAFDAAIGAGALGEMQAGEARLDRARALVAIGDLPAARADLDQALIAVPGDSLAWLLSATLARRMNDLPRAHKDIAEALSRAPDAAPVQLEAGNIAAMSDDEAGAKTAWAQAVKLAPNSPAGENAAHALEQFGASPNP
jgi:tetratricopeptide (TPR) repeat protein